METSDYLNSIINPGYNPTGLDSALGKASAGATSIDSIAKYTTDTGLSGMSEAQVTELGNYINTIGRDQMIKNGELTIDYKAPSTEETFLGMTDKTMGNINTGIGMASDLAGIGLGIANYGMQKDAFAHNKLMQEEQLAMAKDSYNRAKRRSGSISGQMV